MGVREYQIGYTHGLQGRFPMHHRKGRPYQSDHARAGYLRGFRAGTEVARQQEITRRHYQESIIDAAPVGDPDGYLH